jgi:hypothetical protein
MVPRWREESFTPMAGTTVLKSTKIFRTAVRVREDDMPAVGLLHAGTHFFLRKAKGRKKPPGLHRAAFQGDAVN